MALSKLSHKWVDRVLHGQSFHDAKMLLELTWQMIFVSLDLAGTEFHKSMLAWEQKMRFLCSSEGMFELSEYLTQKLLGVLDVQYSLPFDDARLLPPQVMDILSDVAHEVQPNESGPENPLLFSRLQSIFQEMAPYHSEGVWLNALELYWAGDHWNARRLIRSMGDPAHYGAMILQRRLLLEYARAPPMHSKIQRPMCNDNFDLEVPLHQDASRTLENSHAVSGN